MKTVLLYGVETWTTTKVIIQKIYMFINSCLRKILRFRWSDNIKQQSTVGHNEPDSSGGENQQALLEVDKTHIEKSTQLGHKASPHMKFSRSTEERKTKGHIMPRNGDRHEKNEQELDRTRKESPE
ncbi:hypothetical protein MS3_00000566 [Schistosoma haematobium]|uniref:Uncharacterized protein n=1 Tax=Schistosoma haematobium TaxID=6185 RepID=A0A922IJM1_SCHHA|nr:hypothetical protein MS3_00000566 [Schistosoma haematobium]KAH9581106.1 hypothetical protein MS3_00000566 [Schistosoma haematobium]